MMRRRVWRGYLAVMLGATAGYLFVAPEDWTAVWWQVAIGYLATAAIVWGARRNTRDRVAWYCFAVGVFFNSTGILVEATDIRLHLPGYASLPSRADAFYLILYPAVALGLALLIREHLAWRNWGALVDSSIVLVGLSLPAWIFFINPAGQNPDFYLPDYAGAFDWSGYVVSVLYPIGDVMLIAIMVRLLLGARRPVAPALLLMTGSLVAFVCADTAWAVFNVIPSLDTDVSNRLAESTSLLAYVLLGAAAVHPTASELIEDGRIAAPRVSIAMIGLFTGAALIGPVLLIVEISQHRVKDGLAIAVGCITLVLLAATRMSQLVRQLERQTTKIRELSYTDELTGLPNRRGWGNQLPKAIDQARRRAGPLSVAMLDLDRFKTFNDKYGHPAGDRLLHAAGIAWTERLGESAYLARYGGEEFIILLPDGGDVLATVVDGLRADPPQNQTFSAGIATWDGYETSDALVARADAALYIAKRDGRNRTVLYTPTSPVESSGVHREQDGTSIQRTGDMPVARLRHSHSS